MTVSTEAEKVEDLAGSLYNEEKREYVKEKAIPDTIKYHATLVSLF